MKQFLKSSILVLALATAIPAFAQHGRHYHHRPYHGPTVVYRDNWVAPLILGGIAGAVIVREATRPVVVEQPQQVIIEQQPMIAEKKVICSEWREVQLSDGTVYRERTCSQR